MNQILWAQWGLSIGLSPLVGQGSHPDPNGTSKNMSIAKCGGSFIWRPICHSSPPGIDEELLRDNPIVIALRGESILGRYIPSVEKVGADE